MHIKEFTIGQTITRNEPSKFTGDRSFMAKDLEFLGTDRQIIHLKRIDNPYNLNRYIKIPVDKWGEGWQLVGIPIDPKCKSCKFSFKPKKIKTKEITIAELEKHYGCKIKVVK